MVGVQNGKQPTDSQVLSLPHRKYRTSVGRFVGFDVAFADVLQIIVVFADPPLHFFLELVIDCSFSFQPPRHVDSALRGFLFECFALLGELGHLILDVEVFGTKTFDIGSIHKDLQGFSFEQSTE